MSVAGDIADAIVTKIGNLGITGATVVKRKKPSLPQGEDPIKIVVSVGDGQVEALTARTNLVTRSVTVTLFRSGGKITGDDDIDRTILEQIRIAVDAKATFASVSEFNRIDVAKEGAFDALALSKDINQGVELFTVQTLEDRS